MKDYKHPTAIDKIANKNLWTNKAQLTCEKQRYSDYSNYSCLLHTSLAQNSPKVGYNYHYDTSTPESSSSTGRADVCESTLYSPSNTELIVLQRVLPMLMRISHARPAGGVYVMAISAFSSRL